MIVKIAGSMCERADQVPGDKLVRVGQQALCIYLPGALGLLALPQGAQDVLAARLEALLRCQRCLLKQLCCLGQEVGCQCLRRAASQILQFAWNDLCPQHSVCCWPQEPFIRHVIIKHLFGSTPMSFGCRHVQQLFSKPIACCQLWSMSLIKNALCKRAGVCHSPPGAASMR